MNEGTAQGLPAGYLSFFAGTQPAAPPPHLPGTIRKQIGARPGHG